MKNKLFVRDVFKYGGFCFLLGLSLLASCGSDDDDSGDEDLANQYVALKTYGFNELEISDYSDEEIVFTLGIRRMGVTSSTEVTAQLEQWTESELEEYNDEEKSSYVLLPESLYNISGEISLPASPSETTVDIVINPSEIYSSKEDVLNDYVIALKLTSNDVGLRRGQTDLLLHLDIDYAIVEFTSSDVASFGIDDETTSFSISTTLDYEIDGEASGSEWVFSFDLTVPDNAAELVSAYNSENDTDYELLPSGSYSLSSVSYAVGSTEAEGTLTVDPDALSVKYYLLPVSMTDITTDEVLCDDAIYYIIIGKTYSNPIITYTSAADPTVICVDGTFYLYATHTGNYWVPIYTSTDLVNWTFEGTAFVNAYKCTLSGGGSYWAPEIRYINDQYVLYYSWAKLNGTDQSYTVVSVSDNPLGPFKDHQELLGNDEFGSNCIDQFYIEDDGIKYMFFGSFSGIFVVELEDDGLSVKRDDNGDPVLYQQVAGDDFEGTAIYKKDGYYYLFASIGSCCSGESSTYEIVVGRSENILGPYVDKDGVDMLDNSWEPVLSGNGSKWIGPGHNSLIVTDDEGTEWILYHSYMISGSDFTGRHGMLDRLQWTSDGWPYVEGYSPSDSDLIPVFY